MKNQKGFALLVLLIPAAIILIGVLAFGRFYYLPRVNENKNANTNQVALNTNVNQNVNENLNQNTNGTVVVNGNTNVNSNANANTNSAVDTTGWKTYNNSQYFFSLKYPSNWVHGESTSNSQVREKFNKLNDGDTYFAILPGGEFDYGLPEGGTVTTVTLAGREATRTEWTLTSGGILIHISFKTYPSSWNGDNRLDIQGRQTDLATLNQILSTFQFTDETAGWKTYNNSTYKYQIKYPDNWFTKSCSEAYTAFASEEKRLPPCETEAWGDVQISVNIDTTASYYQEDITQTKAYMNVTSETDIFVGGVAAKRLAGATKAMEGPGPAEGTEEIYVVFLTSNNELYHLVYYKNANTDYSDIFDQMVSTFQFTK